MSIYKKISLSTLFFSIFFSINADYLLKDKINKEIQFNVDILSGIYLDGSPISNSKIVLDNYGSHILTVNSPKTVKIKTWGAAGGGYQGGQGAYVYGETTLQPNINYTIIIGEGGRLGNYSSSGYSRTLGNGGLSGRCNNSGHARGSGGGFTALFSGTVLNQSSTMIIAGGGGGASHWSGEYGGNGGVIGGRGYNAGNGGGGYGATQTSGGNRGSSAYNSGGSVGAALSGGNGASSTTTNYTGAGGGGGYYGGGSGGGNNYCGGMGGGGSSFVNSNIISNYIFLGGGTGGEVPNNTDQDYNGTAAKKQGANQQGIRAGSGLMVIQF